MGKEKGGAETEGREPGLRRGHPRVCCCVGAEVLGDGKFHSEAVQVGYGGEEEVPERTGWGSVPTGFARVVWELRQTGGGDRENPCPSSGTELGLP